MYISQHCSSGKHTLCWFSLQTFENIVNPILTKPKPKADPPPTPPADKDTDSTVDNKDGQEDITSKQEQQRDEKMDVE